MLSIKNNKIDHSPRILNDGRSALFEKKISQCNACNTQFSGEMSIDCSRVFDSLQQQKLFNDTYDFLVLFNLH